MIPARPTLENFGRLFAETSFVTYFRNSALVSLTTVLLTLAVSSLGAITAKVAPWGSWRTTM